ncbi:Transcription elongation factor spt6 [Blastocladiella emersonii ATCC 22665]|nr:Transcription elongation factor spt6 [Blastocladiella emersonii ATCC 22665]
MSDEERDYPPPRRDAGAFLDAEAGEDDDDGEPLRDVDMEDSEEEPEGIDEMTEEDRRFLADDDEDDEDGDDVHPGSMAAARRRSRKRRKHHVDEELDDDDLELVEENTGMRVKSARSFKRIKKKKDREEDDRPGRKATDLSKIFDDPDPEDQDLIEDDFIVDDEVPEEEEAYRKAQVRDRNRGRMYGLDQGITEEALDDMHQIFGDGSEYAWALELQEQDAARAAFGITEDDDDGYGARESTEVKLTEVFEPSEVAARMLTEKDEEIRVTDIPERMQAAGVARFEDSELRESTNRCARVLCMERATRRGADGYSGSSSNSYAYGSGSSSSSLLTLNETDPQLLEAIQAVLKFLREDYLEVPFIQRHRRDYWAPALEEHELWLIADEDTKYNSFFLQRKATLAKFERYGVEDHDVYEFVYDIDDMEGLKDLADYIDFTHATVIAKAARAERRKGYKAPLRGHDNAVFETTEVQNFIQSFCLTTRQFIENLRANSRVNYPQSPGSSLEYDLAAISVPGVDSAKFRAALVKYLASRLFYSPQLRRRYRTELRERGYLNVTPTDLGVAALVPGHPYFKFKYVTAKPLREVARDASFLAMAEAERQGFVKLDLYFENRQASLSTLNSMWHIATGNEWDVLRNEILDTADSMLVASTTQSVRDGLVATAHRRVLEAAQNALFKLVNVAPYPVSRSARSRRDSNKHFASNEFARVLALTMIRKDREWVVFGALADGFGKCADYFSDSFELRDFDAMMQRMDPDVIAVEASSSMASFRLIQEVRQHAERHQVPVQVVPDTLATRFVECEAAVAEFPDFLPPLRKAVGVARQVQDPQHLVASLFPDAVTTLPLHPLQSLVSTDALRHHLERAMVRSVAMTGADINAARNHPHLARTLQFVSGLGPRKVVGILPKLQARSRGVTGRDVLITKQLMARRVFLNCASFIRIPEGYVNESGYDPLDDTRIHNEDYKLARKMAQDALDMHEVEEDASFPSRAIVELWRSRREAALDDLSLEDYGKVIEASARVRKRLALESIKQELKRPYGELRPEPAPLSNEETLEAVLGGPLEAGTVVSGTVGIVLEKLVRVNLDNGMDAIVWPRNVSADRDFTTVVRQGDVVKGVVLELDWTRMNVSLSLLEHDVKHAEAEAATRGNDSYFDSAKWRQEEEKRRERERVRALYSGGVVSGTGSAAAAAADAGAAMGAAVKHPLFRPFNAAQAAKFLEDKRTGEAVIRPSSAGENHVAISWVVVRGIIQHLDVVYSPESKQYSISNVKLGTGRSRTEPTYHDLDEILFRYVEACSAQVEKVTKHRKYVPGVRDDLEHKLTRDIKTYPGVVAYGIGPNPQFPGYFFLLYLRQLGRPHETGFKIVPQGFMFLDREYTTVEQVINAFKNGLSSQPTGASASSAAYAQQQQQQYPPQQAAAAARQQSSQSAYGAYGGASSSGYGASSSGYGGASSSGYGGASSSGYGGTSSSGYGSAGYGGASSGYGGASSSYGGGYNGGYGSGAGGASSSGQYGQAAYGQNPYQQQQQQQPPQPYNGGYQDQQRQSYYR